MNRFWIGYLIFFVIYEIVVVLYLNKIDQFKFSISEIFYLISIIGLVGLAFQQKFISAIIWKAVFAISIIILMNTWLVMPLIYWFSQGLPVSKIILIQLFSLPSIPLFAALYVYAYRSKKIWKGST